MGPRPPICLRLELVEERPGRKDRQAVAEAEQMCISGDETNVLGSRERKEVVVSLVRGPNRRRRFWVGDDMVVRPWHRSE